MKRISGLREQDDALIPEQEAEDARRSVIPLHERGVEASRRDVELQVHRLAHTYARPLLQLASRLVGRNDAPDVAQEGFISLIKWLRGLSLDKTRELLEEPQSFNRLIYKFVACRAYDHIRRESRRTAALGRSSGEQELLEAAGMSKQHLAAEMTRLEQAYATLPAAQRIVHVLHHYYGFTDTDFLETLGLEKSNSRTLVHRASVALKVAMEMKQ